MKRTYQPNKENTPKHMDFVLVWQLLVEEESYLIDVEKVENN